jgi:hypothetical protein
MKTLFTILIGLTASIFVHSQQQLQNGNFESWDDVGTAEEEPTNWSSLKTSDDGLLASSAPEVLSKDAGRNGGSCIRLEVIPAFGIQANGIMTNGRVHADFNPENGYVFTDPNDVKWHTAFTDKPDSIVGWYKYAPQNGDKGKIEIILHVSQGNLPYNGTQVNMIARAKYNFTTAKANWTRFARPFNYSSTNTPAYILTTITSGDSTISEAGSTLWIDDLSLVYNDPTSSIEDNKKYEFAINGSNGYLFFDVQDESVQYKVSDISGKIIQSGDAAQKVPFKHNSGIYFIQIESNEGSFTKKLYIH